MPPPGTSGVVSQVGTLVVSTATASARASQFGTLAVVSAGASANVSQMGLLAIVQNWTTVTTFHVTWSLLTIPIRTHTTDSFLPGAGLASYWKLDETGTGGTFTDSGYLTAFTQDVVGLSTPSTTAPIAAPVKFTDPRGRFFPFNSTYLDAFLTHAYNRNFTVSAWVRAVNVNNAPIITHQDSTANGWGLEIINAKVTFDTYRDGVPYHIASLDPDFNVVANVWTHVAIVTTVTNRYVYTNGKRADITSTELPGNSSTLHTLIGKNFTTGGGYVLFQGDLDDIRIYSFALTDDQIQTLAYGTFDPFSVTPTTTTHSTHSLLRLSWHRTDNLHFQFYTTTHDTWSFLAKTWRKHLTDTWIDPTVIQIHKTNSWLLGNMVGYWKLDEVGTAQTAIDSSPIGANATDQGGFTVDVTTAPITAPTHFTNTHSRHFPSPVVNWLNAGVQPKHGFTQNFTVACWYRPPSTGPAAVPLVTHQNASPTNQGWGLMIGSGGTILPRDVVTPFPVTPTNPPVFQVCTPAGISLITADVGAPLGVWTHIAAVVTALSARLFVNGAKQSASMTTKPAASPTLPTYIGRDYSATGGATQMVGDIDEVRIYQVALTDDQISTLANGDDPFGTTTVITSHSTSTFTFNLVTVVIKTYTTDTFVFSTAIAVIKTHTTDTYLSALPSVFATFVQRDNWRNGTWIGHYGLQGRAVENSGVADALPPNVTIVRSFGSYFLWVPVGVHTDPRLPQVPGAPTQTVGGVYYATPVELLTFLFDDSLVHAVSIFQLDYDSSGRRQHINVYDVATNALLDGPRASGVFDAAAIYQTWNVQGHVRFEITADTTASAVESAWFIDPPRSIGGQTHTTDSALVKPVILTYLTDSYLKALPAVFAFFVQRDNWRNGINWIGNYGAQGYAIINSGVTDVMPPGVSYFNIGGTIGTWGASGLHSDPRFFKNPSNPLFSSAGMSSVSGSSGVLQSFVFNLGDGQIHSLSLAALNIELPSYRFQIKVYDDATNTLLDGPREVGDYNTTDVYMTWNVRGQIRFDCVVEVSVASVGALFVDPPRSAVELNHRTDCYKPIPISTVTKQHTTNTFVSRPVTTVTKTHTTNSFITLLVTTVIKTHTTNSFVSRPITTVTKTHLTNCFALLPVIKTHTTDCFKPAPITTVTQTHLTNCFALLLVIKTHTTDSVVIAPPVIKTHTTDSYLRALPAVFAQFVQRDNWRNGTWIGTYGAKGYAVFGSGQPDLMPPGASYTLPTSALLLIYYPPGVNTDPRFAQVPGQPTNRVGAAYYDSTPLPITVTFTDGLVHAVSLFFVDIDTTSRLLHVDVYDADTDVLLDGNRNSGDFHTTAVYLTWNVSGHLRFNIVLNNYNLLVSGLFIDLPMAVSGQTHITNSLVSLSAVKTHDTSSVCTGHVTITHDTSSFLAALSAVFAQFVQRDNWRNGAWINQYGSQGYSLFRDTAHTGGANPDSPIPDVMPAGVSYTVGGHAYDQGVVPGVYTDPRLLQDPTRPGDTELATWYSGDGGPFTFVLGDGLIHAISLYSYDYYEVGSHHSISVYNADTNALLDGPRETGGYKTTAIYMTWNVRGHVKFVVTPEVNYTYTMGLFIDPPRAVSEKTHTTDSRLFKLTVVTTTHTTDTLLPASVVVTQTTDSLKAGSVVATHRTDSLIIPNKTTATFVQRDDWRGGGWIGNYGTQGYAVFLSGTPNLMPPQVSYRVAGGKYSWWLPPGTYTDPRLPQVPGQPDKTVASVYAADDVECVFFAFDDDLTHAVSIFSLDYDLGTRRHQIEVYDDKTDALLDGPREPGDQYTNSVYMTWNVSGRVRFELVNDTDGAIATALFIDPPMSINSVTHRTSSRTHIVRTHTTSSYLIQLAVVTWSHQTSSFLRLRIVSSRSRSQRVGTRTLAFGDSL